MGYFDAVVAGSFKTSSEGRPLFFPWGAMSRGFEVPSEEESRRVRAFLRRFYIGLILAMLVLAQTTPVWVPLASVLPFSAFYVVWARRTTSGWKRATERLSIRESQENTARSMSGWIVTALFLFSAVILVTSVFTLIAIPDGRPLAFGTALFGGFGCFAFLRMLRARRDTRVARPSAAP